jgi:hypothetical protein
MINLNQSIINNALSIIIARIRQLQLCQPPYFRVLALNLTNLYAVISNQVKLLRSKIFNSIR